MTLHLTSIDAPRAPDGLAEFEGVVMASEIPRVDDDRAQFYARVAGILRRLESEARRDGGFW